MPGRPKTQALVAHLAELVDGEPRVEAVLALLADGQRVEDVAAGITVPYQGTAWKPDRRTLGDVLLKHYPDEYRAARAAAVEKKLDDAAEKLEKAPETLEGIAKAREVAAHYRWLASKRDPAQYGDTPAVAIQVNNPGQLFLQAVARPGALPPTPKQLESGDERGVGTARTKETTDAES